MAMLNNQRVSSKNVVFSEFSGRTPSKFHQNHHQKNIHHAGDFVKIRWFWSFGKIEDLYLPNSHQWTSKLSMDPFNG